MRARIDELQAQAAALELTVAGRKDDGARICSPLTSAFSAYRANQPAIIALLAGARPRTPRTFGRRHPIR
jgi:hypothetical protein